MIALFTSLQFDKIDPREGTREKLMREETSKP